MGNGFPPLVSYPTDIDSDFTLYKVYNTTESTLSEDNIAWSEEISINPVGASSNEIWPENGYATIEGELLYYDSVGKDDNDKINKLKNCLRNIGGERTQTNLAGTWIRGFVVAEQHNQLATCIIKIENFIGENFSENEETLDWRIRNLQETPIVSDDSGCPDGEFIFNVVSFDVNVGTLIEYEVTTNIGSFVIQFGDGTSSTLSSGSHLYAPNATIDPVAILSSENCQIVQTPIARDKVSEPKPETTFIPFSIPVPNTPILPNFNFPSIEMPSYDIALPPQFFPCPEFNNIIPSIDVTITGGGLPSVISIVPPLNVPSVVTFTPPISIPSVISFASTPTFSPISFAETPSIAPIEFGETPSISPVELILDDCVDTPCGRISRSVDWTITWTTPMVDEVYNVTLNYVSGLTWSSSAVTNICDDPQPNAGFEQFYEFHMTCDVNCLWTLTIKLYDILGSYWIESSTPVSADSYKPFIMNDVNIVFTNASEHLEPLPDPLPAGSGPDLCSDPGPQTFVVDVLGNSCFNFDCISICPPSFDVISFASIDFPLVSFAPITFPEISINWGTIPTLSGTVTVVCPSAAPMAMEINGNLPPLNVDKIFKNNSESIEVQYDMVGFPTEIKMVPPESIKLDVGSIKSIPLTFDKMPKMEFADVPDMKIVGMPSSIKLEHNLAELLKVDFIVPSDLKVPLVYEGPPLTGELKVNWGFDSLDQETEGLQCFALVPCNKKRK